MGPIPQSLTFNFSQVLELKTDPKQIPAGKFLNLVNTQFNKGGLLQKRNGFGQLSFTNEGNFLTTFNGNLTAIGSSIEAYSQSNNTWISRGSIQPLSLNTYPLIRSNTNQSQADIAISPSGLVCTAYTDQDPSNTALLIYKYAVADSITGQNEVTPTRLPASGGGTLIYSPRVYTFGNYFIILFTNHISSQYHLQFIAINMLTFLVIAPPDITTSYTPTQSLSFHASVLDN